MKKNKEKMDPSMMNRQNLQYVVRLLQVGLLHLNVSEIGKHLFKSTIRYTVTTSRK